ncbi:MAG: SDR family NAD(P)-dependent oxidoreductase [Verrucomicrobia bacterium]|nr:SDR family NAD(P)-dependent oxidoreductase [Verrucomicrobiota bacterium]
MNSKIALITGGEGDLAVELQSQLMAADYVVVAPSHAELDVTCADAVNAFMKMHGKVDLLINNAGVTRDRQFHRLTESDWDEVLATNAKGAFLCAKAVLRMMMKQRSGHIINIGSYSALRPPVGQSNYAAAKAALIGMTQSLAAESGSRGVRVNCVLPGFMKTRMTEKLSEETIEKARQQHVLGCFNTVPDAARFMVFLDSMDAVSGQVFQLDSRLRAWC